MANPPDDDILAGQQEYYRQRAAEYDEWWLRTGRYDRGAVINEQWRREGELVASALRDAGPGGRILELAGGTGIWSERLCPFAEKLTVVDGSMEVLELNRARLNSPKVDYLQADLFQWQPVDRYDLVFFSFWLSHVPPSKFAAFWRLVALGLAPGGRVFFVDSRYEPLSTAVDHKLPEQHAVRLKRRLNDGREFEIYKVHYERRQLAARLRDLGWEFEVGETPRYFIYGLGTRRRE